MRARLRYLRYRARTNLWLVPSVLATCAIVLAQLTLALDRSALGRDLAEGIWVLRMGADGARLMLSTLAGSMITVTSLVFSLTLVVLTLASQQLGPRLVGRFMSDRVNQVVLGVFIATFVYSLLVLRSVQETGGALFVPNCSIIVAMILALGSFGFLIYFVHHVALLIQADNVAARVAEGLRATVDAICETRDPAAPAARRDRHGPEAAVTIDASGYLQGIDAGALASIAEREDLCIRMTRRPGHFVIRGAEVARVSPASTVADRIADEIRDAVVVGPSRTPAQDLEFSLLELVEMAVRALSPGINDHNTACTCLDWIGDSLAYVLENGLPVASRRDGADRLRVELDPTTFPGLVDDAFNDIRQCARGKPAVLVRLVETLAAVVRLAHGETDREALRRQADMVRRGLDGAGMDVEDRADVEARLEMFSRTLSGA